MLLVKEIFWFFRNVMIEIQTQTIISTYPWTKRNLLSG
jgi:hypothetical protein